MTTDIAVIAMAVVALASIGRDCLLQMRMADRVRVVNPPKPKQEDKGSQDKTVDLTQRRTGT